MNRLLTHQAHIYYGFRMPPQNKGYNAQITLRLPDELKEKYENLADDAQVSTNEYIVYVMTKYLGDNFQSVDEYTKLYRERARVVESYEILRKEFSEKNLELERQKAATNELGYKCGAAEKKSRELEYENKKLAAESEKLREYYRISEKKVMELQNTINKMMVNFTNTIMSQTQINQMLMDVTSLNKDYNATYGASENVKENNDNKSEVIQKKKDEDNSPKSDTPK